MADAAGVAGAPEEVRCDLAQFLYLLPELRAGRCLAADEVKERVERGQEAADQAQVSAV